MIIPTWLYYFTIIQVVCLIVYYFIIRKKQKDLLNKVKFDFYSTVYHFKIMEIIQVTNRSYVLLRGIDGLKIKLSVNDYNRYNPKVGQIFCMQNTGKITILSKE